MRRFISTQRSNVERLESRVLMNAPPEKFVLPIGGVPQVDWAVTAYTDQDPAPGAAMDYRGRHYTFDGSTAVHFALPDFATMDRGVDAYAAAPGTVVEVHDGEYDRNLTFINPPPPGTADNYVLIDHGGGWRTRYGRLRNGSVAVAPGQVVAAGQKIGLVGGSGNPAPAGYVESGAVLRFEVTLDGAPVEPFLDPGAFWQSPPPFAGDAPGVHNMFTSTTEPTVAEAWEGVTTRHVFHSNDKIYTLAKWHGHNEGAVRRHRVYRPDGTEGALSDPGNPTPADRPQGMRFFSFTFGPNAPLGTWQFAMEIDGVEIGRSSFVVADPAQGRPEIRVSQADTYVVDGRTTPIDFGTTDPGAGPIRRTFTLRNYGSAPLTVADVSLPAGFSVVGTPPTIIHPGEANQRTLTIQLDDQVAGSKSGRVTIRSDDAEEGEFDFAVAGTVSGEAAPVVTAVHLSGAQWAAAFTQFLQAAGLGSAGAGFAIAAGPRQLDNLPWINLDRVSITFSDDVRVDAADLAARGVDVAGYAFDPGAFAYDPATRTATWRLANGTFFGNDRVVFDLDADSPDGVSTQAGTPLDGDWINPVGAAAGGDAFPSGDGSPGGDFRLAVNILPGDTTGDGRVLAQDYVDVKKKFFKNTASPVTGTPADYSPFHDVDGSGQILARDYAEVKKRFFTALPPASAAAPLAAIEDSTSSGHRALLDPPRRGVLGPGDQPADPPA